MFYFKSIILLLCNFYFYLILISLMELIIIELSKVEFDLVKLN